MLLDYNVTGPDTAVLTPLTGWLSRLQCILSDQNIANRILLFWHNLASHTSTADRTRELQKPAISNDALIKAGAPPHLISAAESPVVSHILLPLSPPQHRSQTSDTISIEVKSCLIWERKSLLNVRLYCSLRSIERRKRSLLKVYDILHFLWLLNRNSDFFIVSLSL